MRKLLIFIAFAIITSEAFSEELSSEMKIEAFELSIMLEVTVETCDKRHSAKSGKYKSLYAKWANSNIAALTDGISEVQKSFTGKDSEKKMLEYYKNKAKDISNYLSKLNQQELKTLCDDTIILLNESS